MRWLHRDFYAARNKILGYNARERAGIYVQVFGALQKKIKQRVFAGGQVGVLKIRLCHICDEVVQLNPASKSSKSITTDWKWLIW